LSINHVLEDKWASGWILLSGLHIRNSLSKWKKDFLVLGFRDPSDYGR